MATCLHLVTAMVDGLTALGWVTSEQCQDCGRILCTTEPDRSIVYGGA